MSDVIQQTRTHLGDRPGGKSSCKHVDIGAFKDRLEVSGGISLVERLQAGRDRVRRKRVEDAEAP